jgi:hypothetical protein
MANLRLLELTVTKPSRGCLCEEPSLCGGAHEAGAPSIGFNIRLPCEQHSNPYSTPELTFRFHYFAMRKMHLAMRANALVVFPGGFGTLDLTPPPGFVQYTPTAGSLRTGLRSPTRKHVFVVRDCGAKPARRRRIGHQRRRKA